MRECSREIQRLVRERKRRESDPLLLRVLREALEEVVEVDRARVDAVAVNEARGDVGREDRVCVRGREAREERVEADFVDEDFGERAGHNCGGKSRDVSGFTCHESARWAVPARRSLTSS